MGEDGPCELGVPDVMVYMCVWVTLSSAEQESKTMTQITFLVKTKEMFIGE